MKIVCCHCYRKEDIVQIPHPSQGKGVVGNVFICTTCRSVMRNISVDIKFDVDNDRVQAVKKAMKLNKERPDKDTEAHVEKEQKELDKKE